MLCTNVHLNGCILSSKKSKAGIWRDERGDEVYKDDMVKTITTYEGGLHCRIQHGPSGAVVETDAPVDNNGKGEAFSPTDLVGGALAGCMATIMGIVAERKGIDLTGMTIDVDKHMNQDPRRIGKFDVVINMPIPEDHPAKDLLMQSALACPVKKSLHPDIEIPIVWNWKG